ncbi:MAG: heme-binding domain-containing protein [Flavobacteriaceae bacterium]|nr:heme-binding domain-containing protein [Flavobacteriaceae bacterium]
MKKYLKFAFYIVLLVFAAIQFMPTNYNLSDVVSENDISRNFEVPSDVQQLFKTSCYDCHSNNTQYPWYNKIQPVSYLMEGHITEGKEELNFNEIGSYSKRRLKSKLKSIISQLDDDEMPMFSYTIIHRDAILSEEEKEQIKDWASSELEKL